MISKIEFLINSIIKKIEFKKKSLKISEEDKIELINILVRNK